MGTAKYRSNSDHNELGGHHHADLHPTAGNHDTPEGTANNINEETNEETNGETDAETDGETDCETDDETAANNAASRPHLELAVIIAQLLPWYWLACLGREHHKPYYGGVAVLWVWMGTRWPRRLKPLPHHRIPTDATQH